MKTFLAVCSQAWKKKSNCNLRTWIFCIKRKNLWLMWSKTNSNRLWDCVNMWILFTNLLFRIRFVSNCMFILSLWSSHTNVTIIAFTHLPVTWPFLCSVSSLDYIWNGKPNSQFPVLMAKRISQTQTTECVCVYRNAKLKRKNDPNKCNQRPNRTVSWLSEVRTIACIWVFLTSGRRSTFLSILSLRSPLFWRVLFVDCYTLEFPFIPWIASHYIHL